MQFFEKCNVYAVVGTQHAVSLRRENPHEIYIFHFDIQKVQKYSHLSVINRMISVMNLQVELP